MFIHVMSWMLVAAMNFTRKTRHNCQQPWLVGFDATTRLCKMLVAVCLDFRPVIMLEATI